MSTFVISNGDLYACGQDNFLPIESQHDHNKKGLMRVVAENTFFISISVGHDRIVCIDVEGNLWGCVANYYQDLGLPCWYNQRSLTKLPNTFFDNDDRIFTMVSCGYHHTVALDDKGKLWSCGGNLSGQLGLSDEVDRKNFFKVSVGVYDNTFKSIACGSIHTVALDIDGNLWSCGGNCYGQLGVENITRRNVLTIHPCNISFMAISCGNYHTVAVDIEGNLWSCGDNTYGQLGLPHLYNRNILTKISSDSDDDTVFTAVSCGASYTVALNSKGNLWSSGINSSGQLGLNDFIDRKRFTKITSDTIFMCVYSATHHTVAVDIEGNLWGCGCNSDGQLALQDDINRSTFTKIPFYLPVDRLSDMVYIKLNIKGGHTLL